MSKLVSILVILLILLAGWELADRLQNSQNNPEKTKPTVVEGVVDPDELPGMPYELQASLNAAEKQGPAALERWLKTYDGYLQDPRKAWIQLDYCVLIARENPSEAKRVFAAVKDRTPRASPVWPRIEQLKNCYE